MTTTDDQLLDAAGITFTRDYRIVPADYELPKWDELSAADGAHVAEMGQRELRRRLRNGEVPKVVLASPERGSRAEIEHGGRIPYPAYAWSRYEESLIHSPACAARCQADAYEPDPDAAWADSAAVLLHGARVVEFFVPLWLGPVADQISDQTGVPVHVQPLPEVAEPIVRPGPVVVVRGFFTPEQCAELREFHGAQHRAGAAVGPEDSLLPCFSTLAPDWAWRAVSDALTRYGSPLGLPVTSSHAMVSRYRAGEYFPPHTDATEKLAKTLDRTVGASVILGRPGDDWQGGEFRVWESDDLRQDSIPVDAGEGDAILFTARTYHEVTRITGGDRFALIVQGEVDR